MVNWKQMLGCTCPSSGAKDWGIPSQALTTEFRVLSWQEEGLREDVESLESMCVLHSNYVFV